MGTWTICAKALRIEQHFTCVGRQVFHSSETSSLWMRNSSLGLVEIVSGTYHHPSLQSFSPILRDCLLYLGLLGFMIISSIRSLSKITAARRAHWLIDLQPRNISLGIHTDKAAHLAHLVVHEPIKYRSCICAIWTESLNLAATPHMAACLMRSTPSGPRDERPGDALGASRPSIQVPGAIFGTCRRRPL